MPRLSDNEPVVRVCSPNKGTNRPGVVLAAFWGRLPRWPSRGRPGVRRGPRWGRLVRRSGSRHPHGPEGRAWDRGGRRVVFLSSALLPSGDTNRWLPACLSPSLALQFGDVGLRKRRRRSLMMARGRNLALLFVSRFHSLRCLPPTRIDRRRRLPLASVEHEGVPHSWELRGFLDGPAAKIPKGYAPRKL